MSVVDPVYERFGFRRHNGEDAALADGPSHPRAVRLRGEWVDFSAKICYNSHTLNTDGAYGVAVTQQLVELFSPVRARIGTQK